MAGERAARSGAPSFDPPPATAHPPPLRGTPTIEESYRVLLEAVPATLRTVAAQLPYRLGLTKSPEGRWSDFVGLHPNRELPVYAAQASDGAPALSAIDLNRYVRAHHVGGFCWLLRDRLEDGQVDPDDDLIELADVFDLRWREAIGDATADSALAALLCERATNRWERGTRAERCLLGGGSVRPPIYASIVREKLSWIAAPAHGLLQAHGDPRRARPFRRAHDLFMLGLQAIDDVIDMKQDRALRGSDVPRALGCSPAALMRTAPKLVQRASAVAAGAGFTWFATWLDAFAGAIHGWRLDGDPFVDELDAIGIAGEIEEAVLGAEEGPLRIPASTRAAAAPS